MFGYKNLPEKLRNRLEIIGIIILLFIGVILANMAADGSLIALTLLIIGTIILFAPKIIRSWGGQLRAKQELRERQANIEALLAGRSRETVLAEAPFSYGRWPDGDDNYVIHSQIEDKIVASRSSPAEAEMWILETYLTQNL